jgi:hypothetical protein
MAIIPNDGDTPFIRTDFSHNAVWNEVAARACRTSPDGFRANLHFIDDPAFEGMDAQRLRAIAADTGHAAIFSADDITLSDPVRPVLCLDLRGSGRSFRIVPEAAESAAVTSSGHPSSP